mmetsp:Transcript_29377/g.45031  ORF Transcript_29377/g.45031 Transcript_29377/m.45031 type:complete len:556 (+) Transcript_29377:26-1693(+)
MTTTIERPFQSWTFDEPCDTMEFSEVSTATLLSTTEENSADEADLVIVGIVAPKSSEDEEEEESKDDENEEVDVTLTGAALKLDESLGGAITELMKESHKTFKNGAKAGSTTAAIRLVAPGSKTKKYILMGMGKEGAKSLEGIGSKIGKAIATACDGEKKIQSCAVILPDDAVASNRTVVYSEIASSFYSSLYSDNRYRTGDKVKKMAEDLTSVSLVNSELPGDSGIESAIEEGKKIAKGIFMTKDIVNSPHNVLNSVSLANAAKRIAKESNGRIKCTVLDKKECEKRGMGSYLGVARGSETEPQFIHMTYTPKNKTVKHKLGVVGKGLLFDTGGYNIKTAMMELMKFDCGGSAAVLGAARAIGDLAPDNVEVHFIVAACENMINERAVVPSDILTASNGKTIEVVNTDAEGRLTLADALVYADKEVGCDKIIELSTLTGACMISLGKKVAGVWTSDDELAKSLEAASKASGDQTWRMPLIEEYNDQLKSKVADMTNCGTRWGGAITAALFLQNFVGKKVPFAHIDIAGPVWDDSTCATGFGAKLIAEWVKSESE